MKIVVIPPRSAIYDVAVIGGGIVGLAVARQLAATHPKLKMCLIEKDNEVATHQSARNSGVLHRGIYYKPKSLKSKFCIKGSKLAYDYCNKNNIEIQKVGKLVVASKQSELNSLHNLYTNSKANNINDVELVASKQIQQIQPGCTGAIEAIWSPNTAIVDWQKVALSYCHDFRSAGGTVARNFNAFNFESDLKTIIIYPRDKETKPIMTKTLVVCAGHYSSYLASRLGASLQPLIVPFAGYYHKLSDKFSKNLRTNLYPVPDPELPFLGVHITPRLDGTAIVGPTAMLKFSHQPYTHFSPYEAYNIIFRSGLKKMLRKRKNIEAGLNEIKRNLFKTQMAEDVKRFFPEIRAFDLIETDFYGVRAQAIDKDGNLVDDFLIESSSLPEYKNVVIVRNCPSPAATSSLAIAERVAQIVEQSMI